MKGIKLTLLTEDEKLEERITNLEIRCEKLNISLDSILQAVSEKVPNKPYIDVLLGFADLEIFDIEESQRMKHFFDKLKKHKKEIRENE